MSLIFEGQRALVTGGSDGIGRAIPLGAPDDVSLLFFVDPRNSWVTGQNLFVFGRASVGTAVPL